MVGVNPGAPNEALYGDVKGAYFWVAAQAKTHASFLRLIDAELAARGMSLDEVSEVMRAEDALRNRPGAETNWENLIREAGAAPGLHIDEHFYIYLEPN